MNLLVTDLLFWSLFGWLGFPFFFNVGSFHNGRFADGVFPYVGTVYMFAMSLVLFGVFIHPIVFWVGLIIAVAIHLSMFARLIYFHDEVRYKQVF